VLFRSGLWKEVVITKENLENMFVSVVLPFTSAGRLKAQVQGGQSSSTTNTLDFCLSMAVLCDWEIKARCTGSNMVTPFDASLLNPASLDLRLGNHLMMEVSDQRELLRIDISDRTLEDAYWLLPNEFCLAETLEQFNLPDDVSSQFVLKSSRARDGYQHAVAGWCDPGWNGSKLTLELKNNRRHHSLPLYPGLKIGQMVFHAMSNVPLQSYAKVGHYNGHLTVMPSVA
jgi:dCTP deaminase